jgi:hypothetical protein
MVSRADREGAGWQRGIDRATRGALRHDASITGVVVAFLLAAAVGLGMVPSASAAPPPELADREIRRAPAETPAAKARDVLERGCRSCHGAAGPAPVGGLLLAEPLALDAIASDRGLVQPGNPDGSRLYVVPLLGRAPHDRLGRGDDGSGLDADDMKALRAWIDGLEPVTADRCRIRSGTEERALQQAARAIEGLPAGERAFRRYVSLASLEDGCTTSAALEAYRKALSWGLFSTARRATPLLARFVGAERRVLELDLEALGWTEADWLRLAAGSELGPRTDPAVTAYLRAATGSTKPYVGAARFAAHLLDPLVYGALLQRPSSLAVLLSSARVDIAAPVELTHTARALVAQSVLTAGARLIERRPTPQGHLWLAWSLADPDAKSKLDAAPNLAFGENALRVAGARALWTLPNGLPAFLEADGASSIGAPAAGGLRCLTCHALGPAPSSGAAAPAAPAASGAPPGVGMDDRRALTAYIAQARAAARVASARLGLAGVRDMRVDGVPALLALARRHRDRLGFVEAAAETGLDEAAMRARLRALGPAAAGTAARLEAGTAGRAEVVRRLGKVDASAGPTTEADRGLAAGAEVGLWARLDKPRYRPGDLVTLSFGAERDCHIVVLNVERDGRTTVLLPNDFEPKVFLQAGRMLQLPAPTSAFQLRAGTPGRERLIVLCNASPPGPDGIAHDFERQKFTGLGDFEGVLEQVWNAEPLLATSAIVAARAERAARSRGPRRGRRRAARSPSPPPPIVAPLLAPSGWTGVVVEIEPRDQR